MIARDLTQYERRIFNTMRSCAVCGEQILDFDEFDMIKLRHRRKVYYNFIHRRCEYGKEGIIREVSRRCQENS